jgi:molybdopterin/thiamine biosynthesis adenylyltransferase
VAGVRSRWWQTGQRSIEDERAWFAESGLEFELDEVVLAERELVVFRGELRLGEQRSPATVIYPASYAHGGHPVVEAPDLAIGRHRSPNGQLCLDHPVFGATEPMCGAEAVERAERLWMLWEFDRKQLDEEEADAPDPAANYYEYDDSAAVTMLDVDVSDGQQGFFRLRAGVLQPLRGVVTNVRTMKPAFCEVDRDDHLRALAGPAELSGPWHRVDEPPPFRIADLVLWLRERFDSEVGRQLRIAKDAARESHHPDTPALLAFVYPDEGPGRGETHDAWLFVTIDPRDSEVRIARTFHLRDSERWLRQPQMRGLSGQHVTVVGVGALGSQIADMLAKAGVGSFFLVDYDIVSAGNRIRHVLDVRDVGRGKVLAVDQRLRCVNPWCTVSSLPWRVGAAGSVDGQVGGQEVDDIVLERIRASDLVVNATANSVAGSHLSALCRESQTPVLHAWVSAGAWAARVLVQRPRSTGCWDCLALAQEHPERYESNFSVPEAPSDPAAGEVTDLGCADPTFTGPGFELAGAAAAAARIAAQSLLAGTGAYPEATFDLATLTFQDGATAEPSAVYSHLPIHPDCTTCQPTN